MGNSKELKDSVKALYMQGKEATEISELLDVAASTIYNWINNENWKAERTSRKRDFSRSPEKLMVALDDLMIKMSESKDQSEFAKYADAFSKITKSVRSLYKD
jgi:transposase